MSGGSTPGRPIEGRVRQGTTYPDFVIDAKALTVFVETGSEAWMNGAVIRNTAAHHEVSGSYFVGGCGGDIYEPCSVLQARGDTA